MTRSDSQINRTVLTAFCVLLMVLGVIRFAMPQKTQDVYISEVCPHNFSIMYDSVGFYHDFIEITNLTDKSIDLAGYGLSDDDTDLRKFVFEDTVLPAGGSIIVWAGIDNAYYDAVGVEFKDEDGLYTQFGLRDHEALYLTDPEGNVVDSVRIPEMKNDMAVIRTGSNDRGEIGQSKYYEGIMPVISDAIDPPEFSESSGFYPEPFSLTMSGDSGEILYTTDGRNPATFGIRYEGPISVVDRSDLPDQYADIPASNINEQPVIPPVGKAFIVRAVSKSLDGSVSEEKCATYFVGNDIRDICKDTYTLSIISDPEGLFSEEKGIYVPGRLWEMNKEKSKEAQTDARFAPANFNMRGKKWRRRAALMLFDKDLNCLYDEFATINIRGATSRFLFQKSFAIKPEKTGQTVFSGLLPGAGDSMDLRTGGEDEAFLTNFRDSLNSEIVQDMNVCAQRSVCCQVFLDGEYWGCYNLLDHINTSLIASRYGISSENINLIKNNEVISQREADLEQYRELEDFVKNNDLASEDNYRRFCEMVDIDSLIDYYCAEIFFVNHDAYINNVAFWRSRTAGSGRYEDCKWRFLLFDTDDSDSIWYDASDKDSFTEGNWMGVNPDTELYFSNLSGNSEFRKKFRERFRYLMDNDLSFERTGPVITRFEEEYTIPMVRSMKRFGKEDATEDGYRQNVEVVRNFFRNRGKNVYKYLMQYMGD